MHEPVIVSPDAAVFYVCWQMLRMPVLPIESSSYTTLYATCLLASLCRKTYWACMQVLCRSPADIQLTWQLNEHTA